MRWKSKVTSKDKSETKLDEYDLSILEITIQFNIDRIESKNYTLHDVEKQSLKTLKELKTKIQLMRHDNE